MNFKEIAQFSSRLEAETFGNVLREKGIPFVIKAEDAGLFGFAGGLVPGGARLCVSEKDERRAKACLPCLFNPDGPTPEEGDPVFRE